MTLAFMGAVLAINNTEYLPENMSKSNFIKLFSPNFIGLDQNSDLGICYCKCRWAR